MVATTQHRQQRPAQPEAPKGELVALAQPRLPYLPALKDQFGIDEAGWAALIDAVYPGAKTVQGVMLALSYCKARNFDPFKRFVHVVPVWSTALNKMVEGVWPGVGEHRATATRTAQYAGCDETVFGEEMTEKFPDAEINKRDGNAWRKEKVPGCAVTFPSWARVTVYKIVGGHRVPFVGPRVYWKATYGRIGKTDVPNDKWQRAPSYMLEKCAEAAALRKAFPEELGDEPTAEEMEGRVVDITPAGEASVTEAPPRPQRSDFQGGKTEPADKGGEAKPEQKAEEPKPQPEAATPEAEQIMATLLDDLECCQQGSDIDETLAYRVEMIEALPASLKARWEEAVDKKRAGLARRK
jgi:phage recombination protein Bet